MKERDLTPDEAHDFRQMVDIMEKRAAADPDLKERPIFAARLTDVNVDNQILVFGPNWKKDANERNCALCQQTVIVRPVFKECRMIVCMLCRPRFMKEWTGENKGASA